MAQQLAVVEATPTLRADMSMREILAAVAAGHVVLHWQDPFERHCSVWKGLDGKYVMSPDATGRRLDFLERRELIATRLYGNTRLVTELTTLGWQRFAQMVRPLTPEEAERKRDAFPPLDPRTVLRYTSGPSNFPRCLRTRRQDCPSWRAPAASGSGRR